MYWRGEWGGPAISFDSNLRQRAEKDAALEDLGLTNAPVIIRLHVIIFSSAFAASPINQEGMLE